MNNQRNYQLEFGKKVDQPDKNGNSNAKDEAERRTISSKAKPPTISSLSLFPTHSSILPISNSLSLSQASISPTPETSSRVKNLLSRGDHGSANERESISSWREEKMKRKLHPCRQKEGKRGGLTEAGGGSSSQKRHETMNRSMETQTHGNETRKLNVLNMGVHFGNLNPKYRMYLEYPLLRKGQTMIKRRMQKMKTTQSLTHHLIRVMKLMNPQTSSSIKFNQPNYINGFRKLNNQQQQSHNDYNLIIYTKTQLLRPNLRETRETWSGVSFAENPPTAVL